MAPKEVMTNLNELVPGSKYFRWSEALWLKSMNAFALPTESQIANIITMAGYLDKVREYYGKPLIVTSWLRPEPYNTYIKGARDSVHKSGLAVDFYIEGIPSYKIHEDLEKNKVAWPFRGEKGISWVHLDTAGTVWFYP